MVQDFGTLSPKIRQIDQYILSDIVEWQTDFGTQKFYLLFLMFKILLRSFWAYSGWITLKNKVFRSFLVMLVHEKKGIICNSDTTFRGRKEVQKNKWTPHYQTEFDGESEKK